jgi:hypothetical protein
MRSGCVGEQYSPFPLFIQFERCNSREYLEMGGLASPTARDEAY